MGMTVAGIQFDIQWNEPEENARLAGALVAQAAGEGAKLAVLPEMFTCGFSLCTGETAKRAHEVGIELLRDCASSHRIWCAGSIPAPSKVGFERPLNSIFIVSPAGEITSYSKTHLFSFGGEGRHYAAGDSWPPTILIEGVRVTPVVCYDLRFPYLFSHSAANTDLFIVVANWPIGRKLHWETLTRARAIESQAALLAVNRIGQGGELLYHGGSVGYDHLGEVAFSLGDAAAIGKMTVDPRDVASWRERFSALADQREGTLR